MKYVSYIGGIIGATGKPSRGVYRYDQEDGSVIPDHWVSCFGEHDVHIDGTLICTVFVDMGSVLASIQFIGIFGQGEIFVNHFADYATDIVAILELADVTDEIGRFRGTLEVID